MARHASALVICAVWLAGVAALPAAAVETGHRQHQQGHQHQHAHGGPSPYADLQDRPIKALSPDDVAGLEQGLGMAMALPAELNGYPGPRHVLEHADGLGLSAEQRHATEVAFQGMAAEARDLGRKLIAAEAALDRLFADRTARAEMVNRATAQAAAIRGALRAAHLRAHLAMLDLLTADQIARYQELRGYQ